MTASQIAEELGGVSRNAVIGKAHRLGLQRARRRSRPNEAAAAPPAATAARRCRRRPKPAAPAPVRSRPAPRAGAPRHERRRTGRRPGKPSLPPRRSRCFARSAPAASSARPPASSRPDHPGAAAPAGAGQALGRHGRQDQPARSQRQDLQMAARPSRRARFPFLRRQGESGLPLLRRALRSPIRRSSRAAIAVPRRRCPLAARAFAEPGGDDGFPHRPAQPEARRHGDSDRRHLRLIPARQSRSHRFSLRLRHWGAG
jgi:GcrA cell cycle regulator